MSTKANTIKKERMLEALRQSLGVVTTAAKAADIDRTEHYKWLKKDPEYNAQVEDLENIALDFAESHLHKKIREGDTTATIFFLKTKGKRRGYIERVDHDITSGGEKITVNVQKYDN